MVQQSVVGQLGCSLRSLRCICFALFAVSVLGTAETAENAKIQPAKVAKKETEPNNRLYDKKSASRRTQRPQVQRLKK